jgi:hypothetical protein
MDNDQAADERRRREAALAGTAEVLGGRAVRPRALSQIISLRLEPQLLRDLRRIAEQQDISVSDVLRQAAVDLIGRWRRGASIVFTAEPTQAQQSVTFTWTENSQTSSGVVVTADRYVA